MKFPLAILVLSLGMLAARHGDAGAASLAQQAQITSNNRSYHGAGAMFGGWGPQLRSVMRNASNQLFFAVDRGPSVSQNTYIDYYQYSAGTNSWNKVGEQPQLAGVQQNLAHLMVAGRYIYSFGISVSGARYLELCYFDTLNPGYKACNAMSASGTLLSLPANSNYVGATKDVNGGPGMVVWWTNTGGTWSYIYTNDGANWVGPVSKHLSGYTDLEYVAGLLSGTSFVGVGQLLLGDYAASYSLQAGVVSFTLGQPHTLALLWPAAAHQATKKILGSVADLVRDPASGAVHIVATAGAANSVASSEQAYFYSPSMAIPAGGLVARSYLPGAIMARFHRNAVNLSLLVGTTSLAVYQVPASAGGSPLPLSSLVPSVIALPAALGAANAVYVESTRYQSASPQLLEVAVCGDYNRVPPADHLLHGLRLNN